MLLRVSQHCAEQLILVGDSELVFETVTPERVVSQLSHGAHEAAGQEAFRDVKTLQLVHRFDLLLALLTRVVQSLVLLLDELDLALHFLSPLLLVVLLALLVLLFKLADFLKLRLLFHLEDSLLAGLCKEHVKDGLHFPVEVKQVIVADGSRFIDARLFGHVLGRGWLWQELISLRLNVALLGRCSALLRQEVGQVYFDASRGSRSQVIRLRL